MKRCILLLLVLTLLLCACGGQKTEQTGANTPDTGNTPPVTDDPVTDDPVTDDPVDDTPPPVMYAHPLNGTQLEEPWVGRPTAVVINNLRDALPHHGVSQADFLYEVETEGGITRMLAIFSDISQVQTVGPVRSARTFFNNIAVSYNAPIVHCGGSLGGRNGWYDDTGDKISGWEHLDAVYYETSYFYRDNDRYNYQNYAWEHTLFATGEKLSKGLEDRGYAMVSQIPPSYGLQFESQVNLSGASAQQITVHFRGGKTTGFAYDAASGTYKTSQYGQDYIDAASGETVSFENVIVLYTSQWQVDDGDYYRSYYTLEGSGDGFLAIGGKLVPIKWQRQNLRGPFTYTLADGTPITLGQGHTYVAVSSVKSDPLEYQ